MEKYHHLLLYERIELKLCLEQGETLRGIARRPGRSASTLSRELRRHRVETAQDGEREDDLAVLG